jgi:hypothetical protein
MVRWAGLQVIPFKFYAGLRRAITDCTMVAFAFTALDEPHIYKAIEGLRSYIARKFSGDLKVTL